MRSIDRIETTLHRIPAARADRGLCGGRDEGLRHGVRSDHQQRWRRGLWLHSTARRPGVAVAAIVTNVFEPLLDGQDPDRIEWLWRRCWKTQHYAGRGAPLSFSLAAVDVALWDLKGRSLETPLWKLLGGFDPNVKCYAGNIDLNFPVPKLLEGAQKSIDAGHTSVKMRLGRPTISEDISRVEAMRDHIGDDIELMADANEAWRVDQAARAMRELANFDMVWLEEPITPDDFAGYAHLKNLGLVPLASGENLHSLPEFTQLIAAGGVDFPGAGPDHLRRHHALHEGREACRSEQSAGHQSWRAGGACTLPRRLPERRLSGNACLRAGAVHGRQPTRY